MPTHISSTDVHATDSQPAPSEYRSQDQFSDPTEEQKYDLIASLSSHNLLVGRELGHAAAITTLAIKNQNSPAIHITPLSCSVEYICKWLELFKAEFTKPVSQARARLETNSRPMGEPVWCNHKMCYLDSIRARVSYTGQGGKEMLHSNTDIQSYGLNMLLPNWHLQMVELLLPQDQGPQGVPAEDIRTPLLDVCVSELNATSTAAVAADVLFIYWLFKQTLFEQNKYTYDLPGFLVSGQSWQDVHRVASSALFNTCASLEFIQVMRKELKWLPNDIYIPKDTYNFL
eukprot:TRINITY_DN67843_c2_g2_i1.p1 TRINITY_DN67843_c2_g2~~TRINITY_DN67843_c2_g2_i1.p1  ORF type:complete len:287 (-),score=1.56 TRINITY_DN67843_c2_g2_i1:138-998(-)